jgi:hypothetical protein
MEQFISKLREKYILHPFLIILLFILIELKLDFAIVADYFLHSSIIYLTISFFLTIIIFLFPNLKRVQYSVWLSCFLSFIFFGDNLQDVVIENPVTQNYGKVMYLLVIFTVFFSILVFKTYKKKLFDANLYLNLLLVGFCFVEFAQILQHTYHSYSFINVDEVSFKQEKEQIIAKDSLPNIYFILIDGYTNTKSLKKFWNYNNQPFLDSMKKYNYHNIENAKSNYFYTKRSLAAIFNGNYLPEYLAQKHFKFSNQVINNNALGGLLERNGYETTTISPFFFNKKVDNSYKNSLDFNISNDSIINIHFHYFSKTFLRLLKHLPILNLTDNRHKVYRNMTLQAIKKFKEDIKMPKKTPKLIYLHLLIAHDPFVFTDKGELRTNFKEKIETIYLDHIKYLNIVLLDLVSSIEKNSNRPSIVLITGDHGARIFTGQKGLNENYTTTTLFYFPNKKYETLYDSMSSVNLFRAVVNNALNKKMAYLPDSVVYLSDEVPKID